MIIGFGRGTLIFSMGTQLAIEDTFLHSNLNNTLLSYKNIRHKGFHVETHNDEYQFIIKLTDVLSKCLKEFLQYLRDCIYIKLVEMLRTR